MFAAHAMAGVTDEMAFGFNFELFTHVTRFCGMKVVLLGLYNGQGLQGEPAEHMVSYSRTTEVGLRFSAHTVQICPQLLSVTQYRYGMLVMSNRGGLSCHTQCNYVSRYSLSVFSIKEATLCAWRLLQQGW